MWLRNEFPQIARGTVENLSEGQSSYIAVMRKTYEGKAITIVISLDSFEQSITVSPECLGEGKLAGLLCVNSTYQVEAMMMGTRIVIMKDGYVQQIDSPINLYRYPASVSEILEGCNPRFELPEKVSARLCKANKNHAQN